MSVVLSIDEVGPCRRQLKVQVPEPAVEAETQRVVAEFRRRARLPGFRKGKVPAKVVQQRYQEEIRQEVLDRLLPRYWHQAQAEANLDPLLPPRLGAVDLEPGSSLTFNATVEVRPAIELRNLRDFDLPEGDPEPTEEEIGTALDDVRRSRADWKSVERPAARGDVVEAHVTDLGPDGEPEGEARPVRFEVGDARVWEELSLAVTGATPGREVEFSRRESADEGEGAAEGPTERRFRVLVDAVKEQELPPLDDELARQAGEFDGVEELRRAVADQLRRGKERELQRRREEALTAQLRERHPMQLPEWVVEEEIRALLTDYAEELSRQGLDVEQAPINWDAIAEQARPQAERRVHTRLLLDAVAEAEGVRVDEDEFEATVAAMARAEGRSAPALRRQLDEAGKLGVLRSQLRRNRTLRHLIGELDEPPGGDAGDSPPGAEAPRQ